MSQCEIRHWREGISKPEAAREMCNSWKSSRTIAAIVLNEQLGEFVSKVMGWQSVRMAQDDIVVKPPAHHKSNQLDHHNVGIDDENKEGRPHETFHVYKYLICDKLPTVMEMNNFIILF